MTLAIRAVLAAVLLVLSGLPSQTTEGRGTHISTGYGSFRSSVSRSDSQAPPSASSVATAGLDLTPYERIRSHPPISSPLNPARTPHRVHKTAARIPKVAARIHTQRTARKSHGVEGAATWYCWPSYPSRCTHGFPSGGAYAAAGPKLRAALGNWRGRSVWVNGVRLTLADWCACGGDHVIDVYHFTWLKIPHPDHVIITW